MLERTHLTIIREVHRLGSLTAAAKHLALTQSALSHAIAKLEERLGVEVWTRDGRTLRLTQAGQYLLSVASRVLPQLELAELRTREFARGQRGSLRIGMECHPCYQWLLKVVAPYLARWPHVDVDVKQKFQFGGVGALSDHEIDVLVTPDPVHKPGLQFHPVFDYEQVLVVNNEHHLAKADFVTPRDLTNEVLITYPVSTGRLDIFTLFLTPAGIVPLQHKTIETTDIMLQMVASGRGVSALPRWLVNEYSAKLGVVPVSLGRKGVAKQIFLGVRDTDIEVDYIRAFVEHSRDKQALETMRKAQSKRRRRSR